MPRAHKNKQPRNAAAAQPDFCSVAATGAPVKTRVRGITADEGKLVGVTSVDAIASVGGGAAVLEIVEGCAVPRASWVNACVEAYGHDGWAAKLGAKMRLTPAKARLLLGAVGLPPHEADALMGCMTRHGLSVGDPGTCTFVIRQCAPNWTYPGLHAARDNQTRLTGPELAALFHEAQLAVGMEHPGFLTLRPNLWTHALGAVDVTDDIVRAVGNEHVSFDLSGVIGDHDHLAAVKSIHVAAFCGPSFHTAQQEAERPAWQPLFRVYDVATNPKADSADPRTIRIAVPASAPEGPKLEDILDLLATRHAATFDNTEAWQSVADYYRSVYLEGGDRADWSEEGNHMYLWRCLDALLHPSMHQSDYKSLLQKLLRFVPTVVTGIRASLDVAPVECLPVDVLILTVAVGVTKRGDCFNPDLAKYIRGQVAIMKRLAITIVEDGGQLETVPDFLALALAASEVEGYNLSAEVIVDVLAELTDHGRTIDSGAVLKWRSDDFYAEHEAKRTVRMPGARPRTELIDVFPIIRTHAGAGPPVKRAWKWAAHMVGFLGAFAGDKDMMYEASHMIKPWGVGGYQAVVLRDIDHVVGHERPMPWVHYLDHHVTRDLAYAVVRMACDGDGQGGFEARHRQIWQHSSGHNSHTHPYVLDEDKPETMEVRAAQELVLAVRLRGSMPDGPAAPDDAPTQKLTYVLNRGTLAAGVGQIDDVVVKTTAAENERDGMANPDAMTTWHLTCCLGADSNTVVAMHRPTKHRGGNLKKPRLTATVERRAEEIVQERAKTHGLPFKSSSLPDYTRVWFFPCDPYGWPAEDPGAWVLQRRDENHDDLGPDRDSLVWSFDDEDTLMGVEIELPVIPRPDGWPRSAGEVFVSHECALDAATYRGPRRAIVKHADRAVKLLVRQLTVLQRRRLVGLLRQQYDVVRLPAPSLQGGMGSDEADRALPGDWNVARALLLISRLVPAALRPDGTLLKFVVVDANVLRVVEGWIHSVVAESPAEADNAVALANKRSWNAQLHRIKGAFEERGVDLMDYQRSVVDTMVARDGEAVPEAGHFVALDVGMGKTLLGAYYLTDHLKRTGCGSKILWFTAAAVVESHRAELATKWGLKDVKVCRTADDLAGAKVAIVSYNSLSSGGQRDQLVDALVEAASKAVCCFDETHLLYNTGVVRNAGAMRIALATPKFVMMTATPVGSRGQKLAVTWLALSASFEVNDANMMVASARMLAARVKLPFDEVEKVEYARPDHTKVAESLRLARAGDWGAAARVARDGVDLRLCELALSLAREDRRRHADGGVFLVAENLTHAAQLLDHLERRIRNDPALDFAVGTQGWPVDDDAARDGDEVLADNDPGVGIVVGVLSNNVGFNLERLGHMVIGVYPSNAASRYQIRGRIKRMTQKHAELTFNVVVPKGTVLELLHERQLANDAKASAIEQIGQEWLLNQPAAPDAAADAAMDDALLDGEEPVVLDNPIAHVGNKRPRVEIEPSSDEDE